MISISELQVNKSGKVNGNFPIGDHNHTHMHHSNKMAKYTVLPDVGDAMSYCLCLELANLIYKHATSDIPNSKALKFSYLMLFLVSY